MTGLIFFEDAVTAGNLDPAGEFGCFYIDGTFANGTAVRTHLPHATLFGITVHGMTGPNIACCDSENGDMTVPQTLAWVDTQIKLAAPLIIVYANLDRWTNGGLLAALSGHGKRIKRWIAHYDNVAKIPAGYDCKQYADPGPVDKNVALPDFFGAVAKPRPVASGTAHFEGSFNLKTGQWTIHGIPGMGVKFAGPQRWASAEVQLQLGGDQAGHWRVRGMEFNAPPLGS